MTTETYYKSALALPLLLALLGLASLPVADALPAPILVPVLGGLVTFALFGGVPYLLFTIGVAITLRRGRQINWRRLTLFAPLCLLVLFWVCAATVGLFNWNTHELRDWAEAGAFFGAYVLGIGYAYALLVELGYQIVKSRTSNEPPPVAPVA